MSNQFLLTFLTTLIHSWATNCYIFVTFKLLHATNFYIFCHPMGWGESSGSKKKFKWGKYVIQASEPHGCKFPGSLCCTQTMTNGNTPHPLINFIFQYVMSTRYLQVNIYTGWTTWHNGINYNNNDSDHNNDNNVQKNDKYVHSEPYGSAKLAINVQLFSLRESGN